MIEIVVLAKRLDRAKERLKPLLSGAAREALTLAMLADLLNALSRVEKAARVSTMTADPHIGAFVEKAGVNWIRQRREAGLNASARAALARASALGCPLLLLPSDIPLTKAGDVNAVIDAGLDAGVAGVRSRDGGTNALFIVPRLDFRFAFGPASFLAHRAEARRLGIALCPVSTPGLEDDVDTPASLYRAWSRRPGPRTLEILEALPRGLVS